MADFNTVAPDDFNEIVGKVIRGQYGDNVTDLSNDMTLIKESYFKEYGRRKDNDEKVAALAAENRKMKDEIASLVMRIPVEANVDYEYRDREPIEVKGSLNSVLEDIFNG